MRIILTWWLLPECVRRPQVGGSATDFVRGVVCFLAPAQRLAPTSNSWEFTRYVHMYVITGMARTGYPSFLQACISPCLRDRGKTIGIVQARANSNDNIKLVSRLTYIHDLTHTSDNKIHSEWNTNLCPPPTLLLPANIHLGQRRIGGPIVETP